jgi:hypothetical protein
MSIPLAWLIQARKFIFFITVFSLAGLIFSVYQFKPWQDFVVDGGSVSVKEISDQFSSWADAVLNAQGEEPYKSHVDVFSTGATMNGEAATSNAELTPTGQLPDHIKVVAVMRGAVATVVIEDTAKARTYFLEEKKTEGEFRLMSVNATRAILMYQGQTIEVSLKK